MAKSVKKRIEELRNIIKEHNDRYYIQNKPVISDSDYDKLYSELENLEKANPHLINIEAPTQRVGSDLREDSKIVQHKIPMLSLKKDKDLNNFHNSIKKELSPNELVEYIVEPKIDGTAFSLEYENMVLKTAATRGDGEFGDDISNNIKTIKNLPIKFKKQNSIPYSLSDIIIRGEIFIYLADFKKMKEDQEERGEKVFENPRNSAAGILKTKDSNSVAQKPLNYFTYSLLSTREEFKTLEENLGILKRLGFRVNELITKFTSIDDVITRCNEIERMREQLPYEIDGVVIKVNSIAQQKKLAERSNSPKWAVAFKFEPEQATTLVNAITWQVGRTGAITPVAELKPVRLAGSTISRATLHNFDEIQRKDIRVGDKVIVEKGGDIIPKVVNVLIVKGKKRKSITLHPEYCPVCQSKLKKVKDEVLYYCKNPKCPGKLNNLVQHFVSRTALDIKGIGKKVTDKLIESKLIDSFFDLFKLDINKLATLNLGTEKKPRFFGKKNAVKVINALEKAKTKPFSKWLFALGIPKLGAVGAKAIAEKHKTIIEIKKSYILNDIILLNELINKAAESNPKTKNSKLKTNKRKEGSQSEFYRICDQIEEVGNRLVDTGWYKRNESKSKTNKTRTIPEFKLRGTNGVGVAVARAIFIFLDSSFGKEIIKRMKDFEIIPTEIVRSSDILSGKVFVLTGTLPTMTRPQATEIINKNGGKVTGTVSKNTDFLLAGTKPGSKYDEAKRLGVKIISEEQFLNMISISPESNKSSDKRIVAQDQLNLNL